MKIQLTAADHEQNGFVTLAQWLVADEALARRIVSQIDGTISDEQEPDIRTAPFTFILDLVDANSDLVDTGLRQLPLQVAMRLAPEQVQDWLNSRPDPDAVFHRKVPTLPAERLIASALPPEPTI